jgi:hypothetical protein
MPNHNWTSTTSLCRPQFRPKGFTGLGRRRITARQRFTRVGCFRRPAAPIPSAGLERAATPSLFSRRLEWRREHKYGKTVFRVTIISEKRKYKGINCLPPPSLRPARVIKRHSRGSFDEDLVKLVEGLLEMWDFESKC